MGSIWADEEWMEAFQVSLCVSQFYIISLPHNSVFSCTPISQGWKGCCTFDSMPLSPCDACHVREFFLHALPSWSFLLHLQLRSEAAHILSHYLWWTLSCVRLWRGERERESEGKRPPAHPRRGRVTLQKPEDKPRVWLGYNLIEKKKKTEEKEEEEEEAASFSSQSV